MSVTCSTTRLRHAEPVVTWFCDPFENEGGQGEETSSRPVLEFITGNDSDARRFVSFSVLVRREWTPCPEMGNAETSAGVGVTEVNTAGNFSRVLEGEDAEVVLVLRERRPKFSPRVRITFRVTGQVHLFAMEDNDPRCTNTVWPTENVSANPSGGNSPHR